MCVSTTCWPTTQRLEWDKNGRKQYQNFHKGVLPNQKLFNPSREVVGEATAAMQDVANLQDNEDGSSSLEELVSSLNTDPARIFERVKEHSEH